MFHFLNFKSDSPTSESSEPSGTRENKSGRSLFSLLLAPWLRCSRFGIVGGLVLHQHCHDFSNKCVLFIYLILLTSQPRGSFQRRFSDGQFVIAEPPNKVCIVLSYETRNGCVMVSTW